MPPRQRNRKRVCAPRRANNGSAFQKCDRCGETVAVAVSDLHECESNVGVKRFKGFCGKAQGCRVAKQDVDDQPRSAFRFFIESFMKTREADEAIDVDRLGFNTWKKMSKEERQTYLDRVAKIDVTYQEVLLQEIHETSEHLWEDEADSAMVERVVQIYERCDKDRYDSESLKPFASFDSADWYAHIEPTESEPLGRPIGRFSTNPNPVDLTAVWVSVVLNKRLKINQMGA